MMAQLNPADEETFRGGDDEDKGDSDWSSDCTSETSSMYDAGQILNERVPKDLIDDVHARRDVKPPPDLYTDCNSHWACLQTLQIGIMATKYIFTNSKRRKVIL